MTACVRIRTSVDTISNTTLSAITVSKLLNYLKTNQSFYFIGVLRICDTLEKANHVFQVGIPERISKETYEKFNAVISSNKPKKGKKGKGKKKKK